MLAQEWYFKTYKLLPRIQDSSFLSVLGQKAAARLEEMLLPRPEVLSTSSMAASGITLEG